MHASQWHAARETGRLRRRTYVEDHPEIPKVRRASRYTGSLHPTHPSADSASRRRQEIAAEDSDYPEAARSRQNRSRDASPSLHSKGHATLSSPTRDDDLDEELADPEDWEDQDEPGEDVADRIDTEKQETRGRVRETDGHAALPAHTRRLSEGHSTQHVQNARHIQHSPYKEQREREYRDTEKRAISNPQVLHEPRLYQRRKLSYTQRSWQDQAQRLLHNRTVVVSGVVLLMLLTIQ